MAAPVNFDILMRQINAIRVAANMAVISEMPKGEVGSYMKCPIFKNLIEGEND